jgi:hypothetical protein
MRARSTNPRRSYAQSLSTLPTISNTPRQRGIATLFFALEVQLQNAKATVTLDNNRPGEFFEETYPIPEQIAHGKEKITVRFQAHPKKTAGGVFACTLLISEHTNSIP